jgi:LPS-assembly protein
MRGARGARRDSALRIPRNCEILPLKESSLGLPPMQLRHARKQAVRAARFATLLVMLCVALGAHADPADIGSTTIDAESIEGVAGLEVTARGKVEMHADDTTIYGDYLKFNREFGRLEAEGDVRLRKGKDTFTGPRMKYDILNDSGTFDEPAYSINRQRSAHGGAKLLEFLDKDHLSMRHATYTTCSPDKEDWWLELGELDLDFEKQEGRAKDAKLHFLDTTVGYLPYASFPLENSRKSGFLTPSYAQNSQRGFELAVPYYLNIAPEQDLTLTPVLMTRRGVQLKTDYRYLNRKYSGELRYETLPNDQVLGTSREGISLQHQQQITPNLFGRLDVNKVSDDRYFVDLSSRIQQTSTRTLPRDGYLQYNGSVAGQGYAMQARFERFQTLQDPLAPIVPPYDRVPQLNFSSTRNDLWGLADVSVPAEYVQFAHATLVEGSRVTLAPALAVPLVSPGWFLTPKLGLRYVTYDLSRTAPLQPARQSVSIPWLSVDSGLVFERPTSWFGESLTQTLEPRLFYVRVPFRDQSQIPLFDTTLADFNYAQIFTENRFVGGDRFGDANEVTLALTSRMLNQSGGEALRATIGQRLYFSDEQVGLTTNSPLRTYRESDLLASVGGRVARDWTFDTTMQYNARDSNFTRYGAALRFAPAIGKVLNASYRYNTDPANPLRQLDLSGQWPVKAGWYAVGRYNYSYLDSRLVEGLAGIEYNAGCWAARAVVQRLQASAQVTSTGIFFQLELSGLSTIGTDETINVLTRSVPGYSVTNPANRTLVAPGEGTQPSFDQVY